MASRLHIASAQGRVDDARLELDRGTDVDEPDANGRSAIYIASYHGHTDVVMLLLDRRADINLMDSEHTTPLYSILYPGETLGMIMGPAARARAVIERAIFQTTPGTKT